MLFVIIGIFIFDIIVYGIYIFHNMSGTDKWGVYKDGNGLLRLKTNRHLARYEKDASGCFVLKDLKTEQIILNVTNEVAKENRSEAIKKHRTVYMIMPNWNCNEAKCINPKLKGSRYRDVKTGNPYVIRSGTHNQRHYKFYMNMHTYKFERLTDEELAKSHNKEECREIGENIIKKRNELVNEILQQHPSSDYMLYLNNDIYLNGEFNDVREFVEKERRRTR